MNMEMDDVHRLERKEELLDNESYALLERKTLELEELAKSIQEQSVELQNAQYQNFQGENRITALEEEIAKEVYEKQRLAGDIMKISDELNKMQQICNFLEQDNLTKEADVHETKNELANTLTQNYELETQNNDVKNQNKYLLDENSRLNQANSLLENKTEQEDARINEMANDSAALKLDNEKMARRIIDLNSEMNSCLKAAEMSSYELLQSDSCKKLLKREIEELNQIVENCLQNNLELRNAQISPRKRVLYKLKAIARAKLFIDALREYKEQKAIIQIVEQEKLSDKIVKLKPIDFAAAVEATKESNNYLKQLKEISGIPNKERENFNTERQTFKPSKSVVLAIEGGKELKELKNYADIYKTRQEEQENEIQELESQNIITSKENERLVSENQLKATQLEGLQQNVQQLSEDLTLKNKQLTEYERHQNTTKEEMEKQIKEYQEKADSAAAKILALSETLDEREHRILMLERDFSRAENRIRAKETELEGCRRVVDELPNAGDRLEDEIAQKRQKLRELEEQIGDM